MCEAVSIHDNLKNFSNKKKSTIWPPTKYLHWAQKKSIYAGCIFQGKFHLLKHLSFENVVLKIKWETKLCPIKCSIKCACFFSQAHKSASAPGLPSSSCAKELSGFPTHLWSQDVEVTRPVSSADELAFVPRRHSGVFGNPGDGGREPVCAVVVTVERLALFFTKAFARDCEKTIPFSFKRPLDLIRAHALGLVKSSYMKALLFCSPAWIDSKWEGMEPLERCCKT